MKTTLAVILVAGLGSRLRPMTDDRPKALVNIGGETILGRAVRLLAGYGVRRVVLATGYREDAVRAAMEGAPVAIEYCRNADFDRTQNSVSLALCRASIGANAFFKLDGDVVFQRQVLDRLDESNAELAVAVDTGRRLDAEAMKVTLSESGAGLNIGAFGKEIELDKSAGESIGIERISERAAPALLQALEATALAGETGLYYEDVYSRLIAAGVLRAEAVTVGDLPWTEVDDLNDLAHARGLVSSGA